MLDIVTKWIDNGSESIAQNNYRYHPCVKWVMESLDNFLWLKQHGLALCEEYTYRYNKHHKYEDYFRSPVPAHWLCPTTEQPLASFQTRGLTPFVLCMPQEFQSESAHESYRNYYVGAKSNLLVYTKRSLPDWISSVGLGVSK